MEHDKALYKFTLLCLQETFKNLCILSVDSTLYCGLAATAYGMLNLLLQCIIIFIIQTANVFWATQYQSY